MLVEQNQLVDENRAQGQQLRTSQAFERHLGVPAKNRLEQIVEGFNGLRTEFMSVFKVMWKWECQSMVTRPSK
jgi:hypothetical protein